MKSIKKVISLKKINSIFPSKSFHFLLLFIAIIVFVYSRSEALTLPYFWDEAWSYIPAIDAMIKEKPCFLPNCINPELYRGHPLLFYFLSSSWGKVFGSSFLSLHSFALFISILTILSFHRISSLFFKAKYVLFITIIFIFQTAFLVQSTFLLPEILITLLTLEVFYAYYKKNINYLIFTSILLTMTKESGIVILAIFGLFHLIISIQEKKYSLRYHWWIAISILPIFLFYIYQYLKLGWFFFPLHTSMIDLSWESLKIKGNIIFLFLFKDQGRYMLWITLGLSLIYNLIKERLTFKKFTPNEKRLLLFSTIFFLLYFSFSAANFLMLRYTICLLPFILLIFLLFYTKLLQNNIIKTSLIILLIPFFIYLNFQNNSKKWIDDVTMNAFDMIKVHQKAVAFLESSNYYEKKINTHFLMWHNLTKPSLGYLSSDKTFNQVESKIKLDSEVEIVLISRVELNSGIYNNLKLDSTFILLQRFDENVAWSEIYIKKKK